MTGETETRLTGEVGAQVAEEIGIGVPDDFEAQAADSVSNCSYRTVNEPVIFTFRLPESDAILVVMTNRAC